MTTRRATQSKVNAVHGGTTDLGPQLFALIGQPTGAVARLGFVAAVRCRPFPRVEDEGLCENYLPAPGG